MSANVCRALIVFAVRRRSRRNYYVTGNGLAASGSKNERRNDDVGRDADGKGKCTRRGRTSELSGDTKDATDSRKPPDSERS